jgi:1-acyl-sn-glycerol-3-phosphate acyltransferase
MTDLPRTGLLTKGRPPARWLVRRAYDVRLHGAEHVPPHGPAILSSNHIGIADGPLLAILSPRPAHALTKQELFDTPLGPLLRAAGQVRLDRYHPDAAAVRTCIGLLGHGHLLAVFPEGTRGPGDLGRFHRGVGYLALASGAPVVPVTMLGTRVPGGGASSLPPRGSRIDIVYGAPVTLDAQPWPRTREQVGEASLLLRRHMLSALRDALALTGRELPGPLPPGQSDDDPRTGVVERGAS